MLIPTFFHHDPFSFKKMSETEDFFFEFPDKLGVTVLVHDGFAHNLLGSE